MTWSERSLEETPPKGKGAAPAAGSHRIRAPPLPPQIEKESQYFKPKTKYTCNPCASIALGNGLGMRSA